MRNKFSMLKYFDFIKTAVAILVALVIAAIIIFSLSKEPWEAIKLLAFGPLSSLRRFGNVIEMMIPLCFTGLAVCVMFEAQQFNMIAEGAFYIGGLSGAAIALIPGIMPGLHPLLALLAGAIVGATLSFIPAILKTRFGASELVSSLMLNYVAFYFGMYFLKNVMRDINAGNVASHPLEVSGKLPVFIDGTRIHVGIFIMILLVVLTYLFLQKTRFGYSIRIFGKNADFAKYSGINTGGVLILSQVVGGGIAGLGGATEVLGMYSRFSWQSLPGYGFDGIIIAIMARQNPLYVPLAALFLAYLRVGADIMSRSTDVTNEMISIIQGIIILLVAAGSLMAGWKRKLVVQDSMQRLEVHHE